ncbi:MAG: acireductone dioxygenase [Pseudomonas sp.]|jgi:1,2-dihydroxy-3-keto-5-methylthiopentene dioxygenase|nr:acireductone dioxygenase [Pseudomonas sp.]MDD2222627.1 acireductone dioxygenase [Pseudomonas sp.]MDY0413729.1 acireductone dioxygenase [Pseudomonas sp.]NLO53386.1 acireductone dioxygenase [Gammaproteobacteria bacterium]
MSQLFVYHTSQPKQALKVLNHLEDISSTLAQVGVRFEHWQANQAITAQSSTDEVLAAYAEDIARLKKEGGYVAVDVMSLDESHPDKVALRAKFLDEHVHSEDEVRFFVSGRGLFNLHIDQHIYAVLCEKGALISVPAGSKHWFDMGERPRFTALRLFNNPEGWVAQFSGDKIAQQYPTLDDLL